jgi:hypothetical protein
MDANYRLKIKIGEHEFEAEGAPDVVQAQFQLFKEMIAAAPTPSNPLPQFSSIRNAPQSTIPEASHSRNDWYKALDKIMVFDGDEKIVSLTVRPESAEDAVLLILLGQKELLSHESVTGGAIMEGITSTGGLQVARVDRLLEKLGARGEVIVLGERRSKTYRLTNTGLNRAKEIAEQLAFLVP